MTNILVVHHDADLYGADRSLLLALRALKRASFHPILAVPHDGPLVEHVRREDVEAHIGLVGKLARGVLAPHRLPGVALDVVRSQRFLAKILAGRPIALVYTNSIAVVGGALWAKLRGTPRIWHVREIVVAPRIAAWGFPAMLRGLGGWCVCNSNATRAWLTGAQPALAARSSVIWNGLEPVAVPPADAVARWRADLGFGSDHVVVALVGRVNRWKGQGVLIDAARRLKAAGRERLRYVIVGDVADSQDHFRESMLEQIRQAGVADIVQWRPFTTEVNAVWAAADIAVVPSTEPEPFGRVAIEAMAHGLPVVASRHGGLVEIVEHEATGLLVPPGDGEALASALARLEAAPELRRSWGEAGRGRQIAHFGQDQHDRQLLSLVERLCRRDA